MMSFEEAWTLGPVGGMRHSVKIALAPEALYVASTLPVSFASASYSRFSNTLRDGCTCSLRSCVGELLKPVLDRLLPLKSSRLVPALLRGVADRDSSEVAASSIKLSNSLSKVDRSFQKRFWQSMATAE